MRNPPNKAKQDYKKSNIRKYKKRKVDTLDTLDTLIKKSSSKGQFSVSLSLRQCP